jgi:fructokinase
MAKLWFLGEALIDFVPVPAPDGGPAFAPRCGGSPLNAAKAAARAGADVGFLGALSTDLFGSMLERDLAAHGIDLSRAPRLEAPTTLAFVALEGGEPRYAFFNEGTATRRVAPDPAAFAPGTGDVVDVGSISLIDLPGAEAIAAFATAVAGRALIAIDPNARPGMTPDLPAWRARIGRILDVAGVVRLSVEDLATLCPGMAPADFARDRLARGAGLVVITHGAAGAEAFAAAAHVRVPGVAVPVVDTVGAGDTLMGTLLARLAAGGHTLPGALARVPGEALKAILHDAVAAAALNCTRSGCAPPDRAELAAFLATLPRPD